MGKDLTPDLLFLNIEHTKETKLKQYRLQLKEFEVEKISGILIS